MEETGATFADVVRVRYIVPRVVEFKLCWPALQEHFRDVRPAATMISAGLADPRLKIEIETPAMWYGTIWCRGGATAAQRRRDGLQVSAETVRVLEPLHRRACGALDQA